MSRRGLGWATGIFSAGLRHADREPDAALEVALWRALAVFRLVTLAYAMILAAQNYPRYNEPLAGWAVITIMAGWSVLTIWAYTRPRGRAWPLLGADVAVTAGCLLASRWVVGVEQLTHSMPTLTVTWMACPVVAVAIARGRWWGAAAAVVIGAFDLGVRGVITQATVTGTVIMLIAAIAVGHIAFLAGQAQERLRQAAQVEAANRERERLARGIHDSVLQVLALVQRRGSELGGEAAELGRLAGEQESALRALVSPGGAAGAVSPAGLVDLRGVLGVHAAAGVSLAGPATAVWLPARTATELLAAVSAAVENVRRHCPPGVRTWILVEEEPDAVTLTVRDDGPGFAEGRLADAAAEGRLGVAQSILGRLRDLGGTATVVSAPGTGTEIELRVPRSTATPQARHR